MLAELAGRGEVRWWTGPLGAGASNSSFVAAAERHAHGCAVDVSSARLRGAAGSEQGRARSG